jgi:release factor glutamine methyltransferase
VRISEMVSSAADRLEKAGIPSPVLDAEILVSHALYIERTRLHVDADRDLAPAEVDGIGRLIRRRTAFEPIAYIIGKKEFYSLEFLVNRNVLIPRPETELVVDLVIYYAVRNARVVDIGTGSGAIAISVKHSRQDLEVHATDVSSKALAVARKNATAILGRNKIRFHTGSFFKPLAGMQFQVIAVNPPYVDKGRIDSLQRDLRHEPEVALFSECEGTAAVDRIIGDARAYLPDDGWLILEIGDTMKNFVMEAGKKRGLHVSVMNDYSGLPRVAVMKRAR